MKRRITAIAVALVVAVIGAIAVISYANSADARAVAGQKVTKVFIATKSVPQGTTARAAVDKGLITRQQVVAKGVPDGAMTTVTDSTEHLVALSDIPAGTVVLTAGFGVKSAVKTSSGVPKGKVAVSVSVSDPAGMAPLIRPGSHIAIFDTFNSRSANGRLAPYGAHLNDDKPTVRGTGVVLPDVTVLLVGGKSTESGESSSESSSSSTSSDDLMITVVVTPAQSVKLVHAIQTGDLYFGLLGSGAAVKPGATSNDNNVLKH